MSKATAEAVELPDSEQFEGETLADLEAEWQAEQAEQQAEENQPSREEIERARKLAEKMNGGFLWVVNRTQCPHVDIDQIVNREAGNEAFEPLAERWGGEVPAWLQQFEPYIAAGVYMATTIATARQVERQVIEKARAKQQQQQEGGQHGSEPGHQPTE